MIHRPPRSGVIARKRPAAGGPRSRLGAALAGALAGALAAPPATAGSPVDQIAQGITGRCSGIDPARFNSVSAFVDSVAAAAGGFATPEAEQLTIDCAETLQLAGEYRDISNPPVTVAIRRLVADCEAADAAVRTCSALRAVLQKAILANSERFPPLIDDNRVIPPPF